MKEFNLVNIKFVKYLFFTGKGGVGKTSAACATAVGLADSGKKVLLISTDPASNLQDVFNTEIDGGGTKVGVENLTVVNVDPMQAAAKYREGVIAPYRGKLPDAIIQNMEEQLSGSCTIEIAAFNEFTRFLADKEIEDKYDNIIFDTAPTGHTLRMLQLPSAWSNFISESTHGASCLGQLSGLEAKKEIYKMAVGTLSDSEKTLLVLVTRPENAPIKEASRASEELSLLGVKNQLLIINGLLIDADDEISQRLKEKQLDALGKMPTNLKNMQQYFIPLRSYNVLGIESLRIFLKDDKVTYQTHENIEIVPNSLSTIVEEIYSSNKRVVFAMGKGGVGKTTMAAAIAVGLAKKGKKVYLTTTDPAHHIENVLSSFDGITTSFIDEKNELKKYQDEVIGKAELTMQPKDIEYIKEDLRSPCTQEIAVFRAFADMIEKADDHVVVIDTAPSGHTLLLLDSTLSYHKEVERTQGGVIPENVKKLLPRLRNEKETEVVIVTLAEATPVYEALRLEEDLKRARIAVRWWIINSSLYKANSSNELLKSKASGETEWINKVAKHTHGNYALVAWQSQEIKDSHLIEMIKE